MKILSFAPIIIHDKNTVVNKKIIFLKKVLDIYKQKYYIWTCSNRTGTEK